MADFDGEAGARLDGICLDLGREEKREEGGRSKSSRPRFCAINACLFLPACVQYCKRWEGEDCKGLAICLMMQEELFRELFS